MVNRLNVNVTQWTVRLFAIQLILSYLLIISFETVLLFDMEFLHPEFYLTKDIRGYNCNFNFMKYHI